MNIQHYRIKHGKGGNAEFLCCHCHSRVRTKDFERSSGNVPTRPQQQ
jgi:hypothetical protein